MAIYFPWSVFFKNSRFYTQTTEILRQLKYKHLSGFSVNTAACFTTVFVKLLNTSCQFHNLRLCMDDLNIRQLKLEFKLSVSFLTVFTLTT